MCLVDTIQIIILTVSPFVLVPIMVGDFIHRNDPPKIIEKYFK